MSNVSRILRALFEIATSSIIALILPSDSQRQLLSRVTTRYYPRELLIRGTMKISFCGRGHDNLLTSHAHYLTRPPTRSGRSVADLALPPPLPPPVVAIARHRVRQPIVCQPQLSFIVPTIYDSVYTGRSAGRRYRPRKFRAIHQPAIAHIFRLATAAILPFVLSPASRTFTPNLPICV